MDRITEYPELEGTPRDYISLPAEKKKNRNSTHIIHTPAAMFRGLMVTQFHKPAKAQAGRQEEAFSDHNDPWDSRTGGWLAGLASPSSNLPCSHISRVVPSCALGSSVRTDTAGATQKGPCLGWHLRAPAGTHLRAARRKVQQKKLLAALSG